MGLEANIEGLILKGWWH